MASWLVELPIFVEPMVGQMGGFFSTIILACLILAPLMYRGLHGSTVCGTLAIVLMLPLTLIATIAGIQFLEKFTECKEPVMVAYKTVSDYDTLPAVLSEHGFLVGKYTECRSRETLADDFGPWEISDVEIIENYAINVILKFGGED